MRGLFTVRAKRSTDMATAALDTNVVLRLVVPDIPEHHERARQLITTPGTRFAVSDYVFVEVVFALDRYYGLARDQITQIITTFMAWDCIDSHSNKISPAIEFWRTHPKLSFEDCLMAEDAQANGTVPLWTFDDKLAIQHPAARKVPTVSR